MLFYNLFIICTVFVPLFVFLFFCWFVGFCFDLRVLHSIYFLGIYKSMHFNVYLCVCYIVYICCRLIHIFIYSVNMIEYMRVCFVCVNRFCRRFGTET